ncbi:hypothetical protein [Nocardia alni]|uniref:hypothetical protein n=1 Tax=Nocardia alni TaxID=2815723 RepID=UPI001C22E271|nr:hypothetical protein [Nocardia alni]
MNGIPLAPDAVGTATVSRALESSTSEARVRATVARIPKPSADETRTMTTIARTPKPSEVQE